MKLPYFFLIPLFTSCSVVMASKREGVDLESIQTAHTREDWLQLAGEPIASEETETGEKIEIYQILKEKGSVARALMHGLLDLSTGFLWELAGTPIESTLSQRKYYTVKVTFTPADEVSQIELH